MRERNCWKHWKLSTDKLCPILFGLPGGWMNIMKKARVMTDEEFLNFEWEKFCVINKHAYIPGEAKPDCYGWIDDKVVVIDFGGF